MADLGAYCVTTALERARALREEFRRGAGESDRKSRIPDALLDRVKALGILSAFTPSQYGGTQLPLSIYRDMIAELAAGDGGMAWAVNLLAQGPWTLASLFSGAAVDEVLRTPGGAYIAQSVASRTCKACIADDGIVIEEGVWGFNSGVYHANWDILSVRIGAPEVDAYEMRLAILPISEVQILDDWDSMGLRGSGSSSVRVSNAFVPAYRVAPAVHAGEGFATPNDFRSADAEAWMYAAEFVPLASQLLTLPAIGMAKGMLEAYLHRVGQRSVPHTPYLTQSRAPVTHLQVGAASAKIDAADSLVSTAMERIEAAARSNRRMRMQERLCARRDAGYANQLLWEAVDLLAWGAGGSFAAVSNILNRYWRDVRIATLHAGLCAPVSQESYGRVACGLDSDTTLY